MGTGTPEAARGLGIGPATDMDKLDWDVVVVAGLLEVSIGGKTVLKAAVHPLMPEEERALIAAHLEGALNVGLGH